MSLWSAGGFLVVASLKNRARRIRERLKQPRYLVGSALAGLYLYSFLGRMFFVSVPVKAPWVPASATPIFELVASVLTIVILAFTWLFGSTRPMLAFSESEIQLLFPAPVSRRQVLHYKILRALLNTTISGVIAAFFAARVGVGHTPFLIVGAVLALSTIWLHLAGISFARASLLSHGRAGLKRRLGTFLFVAAGLGALGAFVAHGLPWPPPTESFDAFAGWVGHLLQQPPLSWLLLPVRAVVRVALAPDLVVFGRWLLVALVVFALHYLWVLRGDAAFEDGALETAERRAKQKEARALGRNRPLSSKGMSKAWLPLAGTGRAEIALAWKNAVATQRAFGLPLLILAASLAMPFIGIAGASELGDAHSWLPIAGGVLGMIAGSFALIGPLVVRADLRTDIPNFEILRALPLSGRQVIAGELLGPWLLLATAELSLVVTGLVLTLGSPVPSLALRLALAAGLLLFAPALTLAVLLVQNAAAVLFPAWMSQDVGPRGVEALGQRLLNLIGTVLVLGIGLLPAAAAGAIVYFLARLLHLPHAGILLASGAGSALLFAEAGLGIHLLGKAFESSDPSQP